MDWALGKSGNLCRNFRLFVCVVIRYPIGVRLILKSEWFLFVATFVPLSGFLHYHIIRVPTSEGTSSFWMQLTELCDLSLKTIPMCPALLGYPFVSTTRQVAVKLLSYSLPIVFWFLVIAFNRINWVAQPRTHQPYMSSSVQLTRVPLLGSSLLSLNSWTSWLFMTCRAWRSWLRSMGRIVTYSPPEVPDCTPNRDLLAANPNTWLGECTEFCWPAWKPAVVLCIQFPWFWAPWKIGGEWPYDW